MFILWAEYAEIKLVIELGQSGLIWVWYRLHQFALVCLFACIYGDLSMLEQSDEKSTLWITKLSAYLQSHGLCLWMWSRTRIDPTLVHVLMTFYSSHFIGMHGVPRAVAWWQQGHIMLIATMSSPMMSRHGYGYRHWYGNHGYDYSLSKI